MKRVLKYELNLFLGNPGFLELPDGWIPRLLEWQESTQHLCLWAEVQDGAEIVRDIFHIVVTGHDLPNP